VHFFEVRLDQLPKLRLDNREIIAARLVSPEELPGMALTGPVSAYLGGMLSPGCHRSTLHGLPLGSAPREQVRSDGKRR
jgi:hypothetical protein